MVWPLVVFDWLLMQQLAGELGATHEETLGSFAEFLLQALSTSCGPGILGLLALASG